MADPRSAILRTTATLSIGTVVAQGLGTASQFLLAAWLTPRDFGLFAIANTSLFLLFALVNLGEVSGFLTNQGWSPRGLARATTRFNLLLSCVGLVISSICFFQGAHLLALLVALLALEVPLLGRTLVLYAVAVKARKVRLIVVAQILGSATKLVVGVLVAWSTGSAVALAVSLMAYSVAMAVPIEIWMRRNYDSASGTSNGSLTPSLRSRMRWGVQSLSQALPTQADYLVVSIISTPYVLGVYFFAYQATVGLSALLGAPLMKSSLAEFGRLKEQSGEAAFNLAAGVCRAVAAACLFIAVLAYFFRGLLPDEWTAAGPVLVILLGSLASRFVTPITEARQVSAGKWTQSTVLNLLDAVGTAAAAVSAASGSVLVLASSVAAWKLLAAYFRARACFPEATVGQLVVLLSWPAYSLLACLIAGWAWDRGLSGSILLLALIVPTVSSAVSWSASRRGAACDA